jgi:hypothetical protein
VRTASRRQQVLGPDEPLLPPGVEDAAGEGGDDVPVGVMVDEGVPPQRSLRRQCELAVGVIKDRDVVVGFRPGEGGTGLAQFLADPLTSTAPQLIIRDTTAPPSS